MVGNLPDPLIDWGNVPAWISAAAALLALVAAGYAAWVAYGQLQAARAALDERRDEAAKSQASKIAAWLEIGNDNRFHAYIYNASNLPVYKTTLTFVSPNNYNPVNVGTVGPMKEAGEVLMLSDLVNQADETHAPRIRLSFQLNVEHEGQLSGLAEGPIGPVGVKLSFTDASSRRWSRNLDGDLTRVSPDHDVVREGIL